MASHARTAHSLRSRCQSGFFIWNTGSAKASFIIKNCCSFGQHFRIFVADPIRHEVVHVLGQRGVVHVMDVRGHIEACAVVAGMQLNDCTAIELVALVVQMPYASTRSMVDGAVQLCICCAHGCGFLLGHGQQHLSLRWTWHSSDQSVVCTPSCAGSSGGTADPSARNWLQGSWAVAASVGLLDLQWSVHQEQSAAGPVEWVVRPGPAMHSSPLSSHPSGQTGGHFGCASVSIYDFFQSTIHVPIRWGRYPPQRPPRSTPQRHPRRSPNRKSWTPGWRRCRDRCQVRLDRSEEQRQHQVVGVVQAWKCKGQSAAMLEETGSPNRRYTLPPGSRRCPWSGCAQSAGCRWSSGQWLGQDVAPGELQQPCQTSHPSRSSHSWSPRQSRRRFPQGCLQWSQVLPPLWQEAARTHLCWHCGLRASCAWPRCSQDPKTVWSFRSEGGLPAIGECPQPLFFDCDSLVFENDSFILAEKLQYFFCFSILGWFSNMFLFIF